jgi:hypothetical protein
MRGACVFFPVVAADQALREAAVPDLPVAQEEVEIARGGVRRRALRPGQRDDTGQGRKQGQELATLGVDHRPSVHRRQAPRKGHSRFVRWAIYSAP